MQLFLIIILLVILGFLAFKYFTRPVKIEKDKSPLKPIHESENSNYYQIDPSSSELQFSISEVLAGSPTTPVGTSHAISGTFAINKNTNQLTVASGIIKIDARTFKTNSDSRDSAIARYILNADEPENEYLTFSLVNLITLTGDFTKVNATGKLTISGATKELTFGVEIKKLSDKLEITFYTKLKRSDFNLDIPSVPFVADVADKFEVSGHIVANLE